MKQANEKQEHIENMQKKQSTSKGNRQTTVSGDALKSKMRSGGIPLN